MPRVIPEMLEDCDENLLREAMSEAFTNKLLNDVWPRADEVRLDDVEYVLVPLDRLGAAPGYSGSKVLIAYYADTNNVLSSSHPLVVKIADEKKIQEEYANGSNWAPIGRRHLTRFARPIIAPKIDSGRGVLLAPFSSTFKIRAGTTRYDMRIEDLARKLMDAENKSAAAGDWASSCGSFDELVQLILVAHFGGRAQIPRVKYDYIKQYEWYLRGAYAPAKDAPDNTHLVERLFGTNSTTPAFGHDWPNPIKVIERLARERPSFEGASGFIHGDLHPRNVVFDDEDLAYVIDFGWAQPDSHIMKDFVMLDVNLRAMNAPPHTQPHDVVSLARFMTPGDSAVSVEPTLRRRAELIETSLWKAAMPHCQDWVQEYVTPLFLISYGLLVYMINARNQAALTATVLAAGELINRSLDGATT